MKFPQIVIEAKKKILACKPIMNWRNLFLLEQDYRSWVAQGKPFPPPHRIKQRNILLAGRKVKFQCLVETGTYQGEMIAATMNYFKELHTIELSPDFHSQAKNRFLPHPQIHCHHGDSGIVLPGILKALPRPVVFWLDGHYSGGSTAKGSMETPILAEIDAILSSPSMPCIILIDDARLFGTDPAYPTLDSLQKHIAKYSPDLQIAVYDDLIEIVHL